MSPAATRHPHRASPTVRAMRRDEAMRAGRFFREAGYPVEIGEHTAWGAWEGDELVGAIALCNEGGVTILRGPEILHARRKRGLGRLLLSAAAPRLERRPCYVISYRHLVRVYRELGFARCSGDEGPEFLRRRVHHLNQHDWEVVLMFKPAADAASND